jgi:hypothetical protein
MLGAAIVVPLTVPAHTLVALRLVALIVVPERFSITPKVALIPAALKLEALIVVPERLLITPKVALKPVLALKLTALMVLDALILAGENVPAMVRLVPLIVVPLRFVAVMVVPHMLVALTVTAVITFANVLPIAEIVDAVMSVAVRA